jgi:replicative DNA helicase
MSLKNAKFLLQEWLQALDTVSSPSRYVLPSPFSALDLRPGRLILIGGPPGAGKTAALLQIAVDLVRNNPNVRVLLANVEMPQQAIIERIVSRLLSIPLSRISDWKLSQSERQQIAEVIDGACEFLDRLAILGPPFTLEAVAEAGTQFQANVLILDYLQRFTMRVQARDNRERLEIMAAVLRRFCDMGACVLSAVAVARQKSKGGSTYSGLNLASLRGSSELEYGADVVYIIQQGEQNETEMQCLKNRYGPTEDIVLLFNPTVQTFTSLPSGLAGFDVLK